MKGDRVEAVVDTGQGTQTFEITARRAGRRIEITTARGVVEVTEVTRSGTPVRAGRFMANRLIALVEHPAQRIRTATSMSRHAGGWAPIQGAAARTGRLRRQACRMVSIS